MRLVVEHLQYTESFHKCPRFDACVVRLSDGTFTFAHLELIFTCKAVGKDWHIARVALFKTVVEGEKSVTGMRRVWEDQFGFVMLLWIIRSIFLFLTFEKGSEKERFINNLVDSEDDPSDMFIQLQSLTSVY
jgi:hypothetical protein